MLPIKPIDENLLARVVEEIHSVDELRAKVATGKQLRVKFGVDCTAPFLHLGHAVNLWVMRHFQECGHVVDLLLGTATTRIGDPTGRSTGRPVLTDEEINANAEAFIEQASMVLLTDPEHLVIRRNGEWFDTMPAPEFLSLCAIYTVARLEARESFRRRTAEGHEVRLNELLYPILQAYDSVVLESDLAPVGSDQLFNEMMGRDMQARFGKSKQIVMTTRITMGLCGTAKQSKSLNNYVALTDSPRDKFGKVMSLGDDQIVPWLEVYTTVPLPEIKALGEAMANNAMNPRDAKVRLAREIVARYHGEAAGLEEEAYFVQVFSNKATPDDMPDLVVTGSPNLLDLLSQALPDESNSNLRRLVKGGGVKLDDDKLSDAMGTPTWTDGAVLKVGKRKFFRLRQQG